MIGGYGAAPAPDASEGITGMTDWSELDHAYGTAEDVPGLLDEAARDPRGAVWGELWSRLCHQGTVYPASHAALPALTRIARQYPPGERQMAVVLAGNIVASSDQPYGDEDSHETHAADVAELRHLTEEALDDPSLADDPDTYVHLLQALLSFEGVEVWSEELEGLTDGEYAVACPACESDNYVAIGPYGFFSTTDSMYMNEGTTGKVPLRPAEPSALEGVARRLHDRALADGHPDVATKLTFVFGRANCAECDAVFDVAEAVADR